MECFFGKYKIGIFIIGDLVHFIFMDDVFTSIVYIPVSATWKALSGLPSVSNFMYKSYSPPEVII